MLGQVFTSPPSPIKEEATSWFAASSVRLGLEYRRLTLDSMTKAHEQRADVAKAFAGQPLIPTQGWSLHVSGSDDGHEYLRFDCFPNDPHYHYVHRTGPGEAFVNHVVFFDAAANGPMWDWAKQAVRLRLAQMLKEARGGHLLETLDSATVDQALQAIDDRIRTLQAQPQPALA